MSLVRTEITFSEPTSSRLSWSVMKDYIALTKPKIMIMLLITAYSAMIVAAGQMPNICLSVETLLGLAMSAGAGATLNMWYDRDIDLLMQRTTSRPIPSGRVPAVNALIFGLTLAGLSTVFLAVAVNVTAAVLSFSGFIYYVVIYTMWLKRRTPQNIVIGGGAGAFPPLVGWAAVTGHVGWIAGLMFAVIFLWTPPHFWALALYKNDDYVRANIPMLPVIRGFRRTKISMLVYAILLFGATLVPAFLGTFTWVYMIPTVLMGTVFITLSICCLRESDGSMIWAKRMFLSSLLYVPIWFLASVLGTRGLL